MYHLSEILAQITPYTHRRRVRILIFRMKGLQILQLIHQMIELLVADLGSIQHVIVIVMAVQFGTQLVNTL